jgi:hypothetical protein
MARWPHKRWTTLFTYVAVFVLFPLLSMLAYGFVRGWFSRTRRMPPPSACWGLQHHLSLATILPRRDHE